jgi:exportin-7
MALRIVLAIPLADLLSYRKLAKAWFTLAEVLAQGHTGTLALQVRYCVQLSVSSQ